MKIRYLRRIQSKMKRNKVQNQTFRQELKIETGWLKHVSCYMAEKRSTKEYTKHKYRRE